MQGLAQAIGGTVTHVQLLVDGKVVQDQTPSGQSSVTVSATFDSLNFAEGYLLPVQMQVWDNTLAAPLTFLPSSFPSSSLIGFSERFGYNDDSTST